MTPPVVLDLDGSVGRLPGATVVALSDWQERIRFACGMRVYHEFAHMLRALLPPTHGAVFLGSGDFHHVSHTLIARQCERRVFNVVVLDNHPDNMRFPFGIHCGSWIRRVAALRCVSHVHVLGITSRDVAVAHAWENYFTPLLRGRLTNWCVGVDVGWARRLGLAARFRAFDSVGAMLDGFAESERHNRTVTYLSIDKDVLSPSSAHTNWDQGCMTEQDLVDMISLFRGRLAGADVTGEVSAHCYKTRWKRWMSAIDRQPVVNSESLAAWQHEQQALNLRLLDALDACAS
jgi:hypothetical protein